VSKRRGRRGRGPSLTSRLASNKGEDEEAGKHGESKKMLAGQGEEEGVVHIRRTID